MHFTETIFYKINLRNTVGGIHKLRKQDFANF